MSCLAVGSLFVTLTLQTGFSYLLKYDKVLTGINESYRGKRIG